jgi:hypothetical protein
VSTRFRERSDARGLFPLRVGDTAAGRLRADVR